MFFFYYLVGDILNYFSGKIMKLKLPFVVHQHHSTSLSMKMKNVYESLNEKKFLDQKKILYKTLNKQLKKKEINDLLDKYFYSLIIKSKIYNLKFHNNIKKKEKRKSHNLNEFYKMNYKILKYNYLKFNNMHVNKFIKLYKNKKILKLEINEIFNFIKKYN